MSPSNIIFDIRFPHCLQACADICQWTVVDSSAWDCTQYENISFIIEAAGHRKGCDSPRTKKKVGTLHFPDQRVWRTQ